MVLGPTTGPTTEQEVRTKQAEMTDDRERVALEASAADAAAETPANAVGETPAEARPGFMERIRRFFSRG